MTAAPKRIVVFGATGGTGREIVRQALDAGFAVTAFARKAMPFSSERLNVQMGDALDPKAVALAMNGAQAVLVALGVHRGEKRPILSTATANIISAMRTAGVRRLIVMSSFGVGASRAEMPWHFRVLASALLKSVYEDKLRQEELTAGCGLDWTVVRPTILTDGPKKGTYRALEHLQWKGIQKISRADVADFMLGQIEDETNLHKFVALTY